MSSKYSAARPKRAGEVFARAHHGERSDGDEGSSSSKKVKFDVRNPSALAPDAREEDDVLDADVIGVGSGTATKRGAVNIDGYDSDSDNETFNARAENKGKRKGAGDVSLLNQLADYDAQLKGPAADGGAASEDEDDDMFGADDDATEENGGSTEAKGGAARKAKEVRFLDHKNIEGQEQTSRSGRRVRLDEQSSSDDEDAELEIQEEGVDEEVGAGGLKKHAPRIDAFNMKQEQEEGAFDEAGNFVRKAKDPDAVHDSWLEGVSKRDMKKAAAAHEKREAEIRQQRMEADSFITSDLLATLITNLERGETGLEALARLGKGAAKFKAKKIPKWKLKKQRDGADAMDVIKEKEPEDPDQKRTREAINAITEAADRLLGRDYQEIYDTERERLIREYRSETGEAWVDPPETTTGPNDGPQSSKMWEYRWTDGRDGGARQGPFEAQAMIAWRDAGYFGEGVEFRLIGEEDWNGIADFA